MVKQFTCTNPPAAPPPTQPVVYTDIQQSTNLPGAPSPTQPVVYAEIKQSTNPPAAGNIWIIILVKIN